MKKREEINGDEKDIESDVFIAFIPFISVNFFALFAFYQLRICANRGKTKYAFRQSIKKGENL